jgi:glycerophosphoryl diester phosphodiesterase
MVNPLLDLAARPVIAHRGASGSVPENTIAAFQRAVEEGADAFELDVRLTADGVPVVLHDALLDRTTQVRARLGDLSFSDLRNIDAGARFTPDRGRTYPFRAREIRIPALGEVLQAFPEMPILVELKEVSAQAAVRELVLEARAADRCVLASEHHAALDLFREPPFAVAASSAEIGALYRGVLLRRPPSSVSYRALSVPERYRGLRVPTRGFVAAARRLGCPVHVWTVDQPAAAGRLWAVGVSGIVTNFPGRIRQSVPHPERSEGSTAAG